jgi:hypothetical protein
MKIKIVLWTSILIALICAVPRTSRAGTVGSDILSMFPKDSGELAYADLKQARQFPWFPQLKEQMLPPKFREFETFLASAGIDPNSQVTPARQPPTAPEALCPAAIRSWESRLDSSSLRPPKLISRPKNCQL